MKVRELGQYLEEVFPLDYQEEYDNAGLQVGDPAQEVTGILIAVDISEQVVDEALQKGANFILTHHPLIFHGIKRIIEESYSGHLLTKIIRNKINVYACHTNVDNLKYGLNARLAEKIGLTNPVILVPQANRLRKLVTFVPDSYADQVRGALFEAGAGQIGAYDQCSFNADGSGTFRALENTHPFVGERFIPHTEPEVRIETIFPVHLQSKVLNALIRAHPYEEVAFDVYPLDNVTPNAGAGMIGDLREPLDEHAFLLSVKDKLGIPMLRHTALTGRMIKKVAVCGGSGSFLIQPAKAASADAFVTADVRYHQFFDTEGKILLVDAGHFETEAFVKELFHDILMKKFPTFAVHFSAINTNPVNYL